MLISNQTWRSPLGQFFFCLWGLYMWEKYFHASREPGFNAYHIMRHQSDSDNCMLHYFIKGIGQNWCWCVTIGPQASNRTWRCHNLQSKIQLIMQSMSPIAWFITGTSLSWQDAVWSHRNALLATARAEAVCAKPGTEDTQFISRNGTVTTHYCNSHTKYQICQLIEI